MSLQISSSVRRLDICQPGMDVNCRIAVFKAVPSLNDAASGLIWVENQVSLGANEMVMGKARFKQWLYDQCVYEVKHYHGNNGIFFAKEFWRACEEKQQSQSFSGVGAQHQNAHAEHAIQTIMYMAQTFMVHASLHLTERGSDNLSLWSFAVKHLV